MLARCYRLLAVILALALGSPAAAQNRALNGHVTDAVSGKSIEGAQVYIVGTKVGGITGADGAFSLIIPEGPQTLGVEMIGYKRKTVAIPPDMRVVEVTLETDVLGLEQIVVTGQATGVSRRNLANAVGTVSNAELNKAPASSLEQMMAGKMASVLIQQNSGAPGGGSRVRLRGITSIIGSGQPLYVVDGVIVSDSRADGGMNAVSLAQGRNNISSTEQMNPINRIADLNPADIDRIEVLKGASAAAIYGSKAANGVIIITTKRGQEGAPQYHFRQGFGVATRAFTYGSRYFETLADAVDAFGPKAADYWTSGYTPVSLEDQISGQKPLQMQSDVSVSGGAGGTRYFASALYRHEPGIVIDTYADKASLRLNLDQTLGSRVSVSTSTEVIRNQADRGMFGNDNAGTSYYFVLPHTPNFVDLRPTCPDGSRKVGCAGGVYPDNPFVASNPLQSAALMSRKETVWRTLGTGKVSVEAINSDRHQLQLSALAGFDQFTQNFDLISPPELQFEGDDGLPGTRVLSYGSSLNTNINANIVDVYNPSWYDLKATTSLGVQFERRRLNIDRNASRGLIGGTPNLGAGVSPLIEEQNSEIKDLGFFLQEEVLLKDRLLLTAGGRADRSSNNGDPNQLHYYPKAAASYRFPVGGPVDELKLRAAYGQSGNQPNFGQKFTNMQTTNVAGVGGLLSSSTAGAPKVKPERQVELEGGFDATLLDGVALLQVTGYQKTVKDLLLQRTLAPSTGFTSEIFNGGKLRVWGLELVVNATPIRSESLTWSAAFNWSMDRSKVLELPVPAFVAEGFYSQGAIRIEQGKSATQWVANDTLPGASTSDNPQVIVRAQGDAEPRWIAGLTSSVDYHRLSLSVTFDAVKGGLINLGTWRHWDSGRNAYDYDQIDPATGLKKGVERRMWSRLVPRTYTRDASFIKLREVQIGADLPRSMIDRLWGGIKSARISLSGRNLLTNQSLLGGDFYQGTDPEVANYNSGSEAANNVMFTREFAAYPSSRSFWLSFDLTF